MNNEYLTGSLAWSFVGAIFGYSVCFVQMKLTNKVRESRMSKSDSSTSAHRGGYRDWWRRRKMYVFFAAVGIGMVFQQISFQRSDDAANACLVEQVTAITEAFQARAEISNDVSDANQKVIQDIADAFPKQDLPAIEKALGDYNDAQEKIRVGREANPVPPFPNGKCD